MKSIITLFLALISSISIAQEQNKKHRLLLDKVFNLLETNIVNPQWLKEESFLNFKSHMYEDKILSLNTKTFYETFNHESKSLPFTHFYLNSKPKEDTKENNSTKKHAISWKALNNKTAYLDVKSFSGGTKEIKKAIEEIGINTYKNLIIDLRDNGGDTLDAPVILGQFLTNKSIDAGVYLTRKWFKQKSKLPNVDEISKFPYLTDFTYVGIMKMFMNEAAFRMVIPPHSNPVFKGKVFVLTNKQTASACEPLLYLFKEQKIATLVGSVSAGAMLSGNSFEVSENCNVFIPIADYQTYTGKRIDKVGVTPNIVIDSNKALDYVFDKLIH